MFVTFGLHSLKYFMSLLLLYTKTINKVLSVRLSAYLSVIRITIVTIKVGNNNQYQYTDTKVMQ